MSDNPYSRQSLAEPADEDEPGAGTVLLATCYLGAGAGSAGAFVFANVWGVGVLWQGAIVEDWSTFLSMMGVAAATGGTLVGVVSGLLFGLGLLVARRILPFPWNRAGVWFIVVLTILPALAIAAVLWSNGFPGWIPAAFPCQLVPTMFLGKRWRFFLKQIEEE